MNTNKIDIQLTSKDIIRFKENTETIIYRILCECINNTLKHAKANEITISLLCENNQLIIEYSDNGIGFDVDKAFDVHKGIGLMNMKSRIMSMNGLLEIKSRPQEGILIKFQFDMHFI